VVVISFITIGSGVSIYAVIPALLYAGIRVIQKQILSFLKIKIKIKWKACFSAGICRE
jgi:hypothetical protein